MKITLNLEMDDQTAKLFLHSAIERVINSSLRIIENQEGYNEHEFTGYNLEDWREWKPIIVCLWCAIHDAVYRQKNDLPESDQTFVLTKGE